jgi:hypothetical protein
LALGAGMIASWSRAVPRLAAASTLAAIGVGLVAHEPYRRDPLIRCCVRACVLWRTSRATVAHCRTARCHRAHALSGYGGRRRLALLRQ